jgi:hypothetical protein
LFKKLQSRVIERDLSHPMNPLQSCGRAKGQPMQNTYMEIVLVLTPPQQQAVLKLLPRLIDQSKAQVIVSPNAPASGYWFGGGNLLEDDAGVMWLCGRYRNAGDSRSGLGQGERGLECAIFKSTDHGRSFTKVVSLSKDDLSRPEREVISIEGCGLNKRPDGTVELFVSSEKCVDYPEALKSFQKPGTGVWTIDRLTGRAPDQLDISSLETVLENFGQPEYLHLKDPVPYNVPDGTTILIFCSHPFNWSSANSGLACRFSDDPKFEIARWETVLRGAAWDVAATRITDRMLIPKLGVFADSDDAAVYFYDGAECLRQLDENPNAFSRPRGYSCEELGGAFVGGRYPSPKIERLSLLAPLFVSPQGTGSSRYVSTLVTNEGILATWQQSQADQSQPLVSHFLPMAEVEAILAHE